MREKVFKSTGEVVYQVLIFATLIAYFTALFRMNLPSSMEHFAVIASAILATLVFAAMLAADEYFSRLNIRLVHIAKAMEQSLIANDKAERIESAIKTADSLSNQHFQRGVISIFLVEIVVSIYLASLLSGYLARGAA